MTETWLTNDHSDTELRLTHYIIYRRDRNSVTRGKSRKGRTLIAVRQSFQSVILEVSANCDMYEQSWVQVILRNRNILSQ